MDGGLVRSQEYGQILRASSIMGGAQGLNYALSLLRTKLVAMLLGPSGVGLLGLFSALSVLLSTASGLGFDSSGVRQVAEAGQDGDPKKLSHTVKALQRASLVLGIVGWLLTATFAYHLSIWTFGFSNHTISIVLLGGTVFLATITGALTAILQGTRRISDLARVQVLTGVATTIASVGLYWWLGKDGIVPVLILSGIANVGIAAWFVRRVQLVTIIQTPWETWRLARRLIALGLAFTYGALLAALVGFVIRMIIVREFGLDAGGIYQAAWALSGLFAAFVIGAMGADFFPRLTAAAQHNPTVNRLVNQQTEIGVLLSLPGLLITLLFAPQAIGLFYSSEFLPAAEFLPWFSAGVFGQMITFPMGYIQRAKGKTVWIVVSQSHLNLLYVALAVVLIPKYGALSAAWAFAFTTYFHGLLVFAIARRLSGFSWESSTFRLILSSSLFVGIAFLAQHQLTGHIEMVVCVAIAATGSLFSLRGVSRRLTRDHRLVRLLMKLPGGQFISGL